MIASYPIMNDINNQAIELNAANSNIRSSSVDLDYII